MAKIDFTTLARPEAVTEAREFTDPLQPDMPPIALTFTARPDHGLLTLAAEQGLRFAQKYAPGVAKSPAPFPPLGGAPVTITRSLCLEIGGLMTLQAGEDAYNFIEWVACSVNCPNAYAEITSWGDELLARAAAGPPESEGGDPTDPKNDSAARGAFS